MGSIKGPSIFFAQFASDAAPKCKLRDIAGWASDSGYEGVQIPCFESRLFDLDKAADSQVYATRLKELANRRASK